MSIDLEDFDNPEYVKIFREIVQEDVERFHRGEPLMINLEPTTLKWCEQYLPGDVEKQIDLIMCIMEAITRAEQLGYEQGSVPKSILDQMTKKYGVKKILDLEIHQFFRSKSTGIIMGGSEQ